jgi:hypothetical protein
MYDFMKMIWKRMIYLMPSAARDIPPNQCSQQFYYRKFKGGMNKHRDVKKKKDGTYQFLPGTPIVSVTIAHPMLFEVYAPVDKDKKETYSSNAVKHFYKNMISDILISHGQVLIWKARDDERYMHALRFEKEDFEKKSDSVFRVSFLFRWVVGRGKYYIYGPNYGYTVEK